MERVVIIGGGYAGIYALRELVKKKNIKITLIDKHTYHNLQPEVYDLIANKSNFADVTIDLTTLCMGFNHDYLEFKNLKVRRIDQVAKKIYTEEEEIVEFDYLIMAAGTRTFFPASIPGLNNADDIKKLHRAITFKQSFEQQLFEKIRNEAKQCADTRIVVVEIKNRVVGFIVDEVNEVLRIPQSITEAPPDMVGGIASDYIISIGKLEDRLLILLDLEKMLPAAEYEALEMVV